MGSTRVKMTQNFILPKIPVYQKSCNDDDDDDDNNNNNNNNNNKIKTSEKGRYQR